MAADFRSRELAVCDVFGDAIEDDRVPLDVALLLLGESFKAIDRFDLRPDDRPGRLRLLVDEVFELHSGSKIDTMLAATIADTLRFRIWKTFRATSVVVPISTWAIRIRVGFPDAALYASVDLGKGRQYEGATIQPTSPGVW